MGDVSGATEPRIVARVEANFVDHLTWPHRATPGMQVIERGECVVSNSGLATDTFNTIYVRGVPSTPGLGGLPSAVQHFRSRSMPYAVWLGPLVAGSGWAGPAELGLRQTEQEVGMWLDLSRWEPAEPSGPVQIRRVADRPGLDDFTSVLAALGGPPVAPVIEFYRRAAGAILAPGSPMTLLVGYCDDEPVGTVQVFVADGAAGLYDVAARPSHRRQGVGTAVVRAALSEAVRRGCDLAGLQASPEGLPVYRRLGFRECGTFLVFQDEEEGTGAAEPGGLPGRGCDPHHAPP
jgi:ribosomal protein S18 acetylase RimI-like enzyme